MPSSRERIPQASRLAKLDATTLVKFRRPFDNGGSTSGYVVAQGPSFFLLALVSDSIHFNGFNCIRHRDVRSLEVPARHATFIESALRLRGEQCPRTPSIKLSNATEILRSLQRSEILVTIHRENVDPSICQIGRVVAVTESQVALLEIDAAASWDSQPTRYQTREITRIDFGGAYEEALMLVAGVTPTIKP